MTGERSWCARSLLMTSQPRSWAFSPAKLRATRPHRHVKFLVSSLTGLISFAALTGCVLIHGKLFADVMFAVCISVLTLFSVVRILYKSNVDVDVNVDVMIVLGELTAWAIPMFALIAFLCIL